jgi:division protein CdvB (Snf7/Vps24/ESCRT-III family)
MTDEKVTINISKEISEKIKKRIKGTGFETIDSYVEYVLKEVISDLEEETDEDFTKEDEEKVKDRLRALGYLD